MANSAANSNIYTKISIIIKKCNAKKSGKIRQQNGQYSVFTEQDIINAVKAQEEQHGILSYPFKRTIVNNEILDGPNGTKKFFVRLEVTYRFVNLDNPTEFIDIISYGDGIDSQERAPGKAMTYADKYALMKMYKIVTGDDPDVNRNEDRSYFCNSCKKTITKDIAQRTYKVFKKYLCEECGKEEYKNKEII